MAIKRVLLVDDEADFLEIMGMRVREWGYELIKAENGKDAIDAMLTKNPDMVILDYRLPDMDGIAVLKEIRKLNKQIPVIMFTAYPEAKTMREANEFGVNAFIPKFSIYSEVMPSVKEAINLVDKRLSDKG